MSTPEEFLQFLYDLNVIAFIERTEDAAAYGDSSEEKKFTRWCFRERGPANISGRYGERSSMKFIMV